MKPKFLEKIEFFSFKISVLRFVNTGPKHEAIDDCGVANELSTCTQALLPTSTHSNGFCIVRVCISSSSSSSFEQEKKLILVSIQVQAYGAYGARQEHHGTLFPMMKTG